MQLRLEKRTDVNSKDNFRQTALHKAVDGGHKAIVRMLFNNEVDVNAKYKNGTTALTA